MKRNPIPDETELAPFLSVHLRVEIASFQLVQFSGMVHPDELSALLGWSFAVAGRTFAERYKRGAMPTTDDAGVRIDLLIVPARLL